VLSGEVAEHLNDIFHLIADQKGLTILNLTIMPDHIHLFISSPPQNAPSLIVNWLKGISARMYNHWYKEPHIKWTNSYYVGTAGTVSAETIQKYIEEQKSK
jgi:putative transposase